MPRPPVRPEDRQRIAWACDSCKASKKRCDGNQPCGACNRKGLTASCRYVAGRRTNLRPQAASAHAQQQRELRPTTRVPRVSHPDALSPAVSDRHHAGTESLIDIANQSEASIAAQCTNASSSRSGSGIFTPPNEAFGQPAVMLSTLSGEKVFIGDTAAISFLRFLQRTLRHHVGPSGFTDDQDSHRLFEVTSPDTGTARFYDDLNTEAKKSYIQCFLDASSGLLDLYTWSETFQMLRCSEESSQTGASNAPQKKTHSAQASLYMMIAIGAQCRGHGRQDLAYASKYFSQARKMSFDKMLEDPTLDLIRSFLLMSFYMLGACRRNSAFMYIGVASKAADILGLHVSAQSKYLPQEVRDARLRTARSLRVLDVVCSSILGRRSSAMLLRPGNSNRTNENSGYDKADNYRGLALMATYELSAVLDAAVAKSAEEGLGASSAEEFLQALRQRSRELPAALRQEPGKTSGNPEVTIGNIHVAGTYYFGVILVTRHFLIQHVMPRLRGGPGPTRRAKTLPGAAGSNAVAELSCACIEAATYMAQMCRQALDAGALLGNMCIIKAWIFATGLVLGFSLLVEDNNNSEGREAFLSSIQILSELKRLSPQAEQYHGILTNFSKAIDAYKEQLRHEKHAARGSLVERIFSSAPGNDSDFGEVQETTAQLPTPNITVLDDSSTTWLGEDTMSSFDGSLSEQWCLPGENDVIMRLLWDGGLDWTDPSVLTTCLDLPSELAASQQDTPDML